MSLCRNRSCRRFRRPTCQSADPPVSLKLLPANDCCLTQSYSSRRQHWLKMTRARSDVSGKMLPSIELPSFPGTETNLLQFAKELASEQLSLIVCISAGPKGSSEVDDTIRACGWKQYRRGLEALRCRLVWVSACPLDVQREWAAKEGMDYRLLSDPNFELAQKPGIPIQIIDGAPAYESTTLATHAGEITQVFSAVDSREDAHVVIAWMKRAIDA
jgi:peroxiredoxin